MSRDPIADATGLRDAVALVTGGGSGIGEAVAEVLAAAGAIVAVTDLDEGNAARVASRLPNGAIGMRLDVTRAADVERVVDEVESRLGPIHVLASVAGLFASAPLVESADAEWDRLFDVNARGVFHCIRAVARRMRPRKRGSIVTVASQSACVVRFEQVIYGASKAAAAYVTKCAGLELARDGIRCNVVHPGVTDTPLARRLWDAGKGSPEAHVAGNPARYRAPIPLGKVATTRDVANAVLFLASDLASHVTMEDVVVDGGATLSP